MSRLSWTASRSFFMALLGAGFVAGPACDDAAAPGDTVDAHDSIDANDTLDTADVGADSVDANDAEDDTEVPLGDDVYGPRPRPPGPLPEVLLGPGWVSHWRTQIAPFWTSAEALGTPVGNFPTYRGMDGRVTGSSRRRPRMISRQVYAYSAGYLMTGDATLLAHAKAGVDWLQAHAIDRVNGGCYAELDADGNPVDGVRTAQDLAYCMMGIGAWYFVTRDPGVEADLLAARNLFFDPARYWDSAKGRVRDALGSDMTTPVDVENDGGSELVAQLDPVNAFMLLVQPVLARPGDRALFLEDLRKLGQVLVRDFHHDGLFWGVDTNKGRFGTKHVDFGHIAKTYWMLLEIDKRLPDHPFHDLVVAELPPLLARAYDADNGRWAKRPTGTSTVEYGSDWWIYAELDQISATLDLAVPSDVGYVETRAATAGHWLTDYVDATWGLEVIPSIKRDGSRGWSWPVTDTAKCNEWKNGFHSSEHALILSLLGDALADLPTTLHFALVDPTLDVRPYLFHGRELDRTPSTPITVGTLSLMPLAVRFTDLW